eukprot:TRINITY_DN13095_c0_g1_i1.p1 TRINITY_DN13095_c0_g1~~TRINITY_DN13095_c0_g1_i1.p1  ORF type:complete len:467 (+),score=135.23 TRINITY_DN13095_c0_g1_i1:33-1433(+)
MKRRVTDFETSPNKAQDPSKTRVEYPDLEFEDAHEDSFESESVASGSEHESEEGNMDMDEDEAEEQKEVWIPSARPLEEGETLEYDPSTYDMLHVLTPQWPCLSFDILPDNLGFQREKYPHTMYLVAGTQAERSSENSILLMKLSDLSKTKEDESDDGGFNVDGSSSGGDEDPVLEVKSIPHSATINRIRAMPQNPHIVACMNEDSSAEIFNFQARLASLDKPAAQKLKTEKPVYTFKGHPTEGYGLQWSPKETGRLITSDCARNIFWWNPTPTGWAVDQTPFAGHTKSVEDLQWSPSEPDVFASCSVDKLIHLWDARKGKSPVATIAAHDSDVNVISWNNKRGFLLASGSEDGNFKIWNLKKLKDADMKPAFSFGWHKSSITSVEWNPNDDSQLSVSSADHSVTVWDLSLTAETTQVQGVDIPSQLMFAHHGQQYIKEVHWHKQIPGVLVSTALDGFNVFKPFNL